MSPLEVLRSQITSKRNALQALADAATANGETRDLTADESARFDALVAEVGTLQAKLTALEAVEPAPAPAVEGRGRRSAPFQESGPAIHTRDAQRPYSIVRAICCQVEGRALDGLEAEVANEIQRQTGRIPSGILIPTGSNPVVREMLRYGTPERRDAVLSTTTGAGAIFNAPMLPLIDMLRHRLLLSRLGATILTDMQGVFSMSRQTGTSTTHWLNEGQEAETSAPTFGQVNFSPKIAITAVPVTKQFIKQSSLDVEQVVSNDIATQMAVELDRVAFAGSGGAQPQGILSNPAIPTVSLGANGGAASFASLVALESAVAVANGDYGKLAYVTNPKVRGALKVAPKGTAGYPTFVWEDGSEPGVGELNGYPAYSTGNIPANLTKGSGSNLSAAIFGNWSDLVVALYEGVDVSILVNPYTPQLSGGIIISGEMAVDIQVRNPASFAKTSDIQIS